MLEKYKSGQKTFHFLGANMKCQSAHHEERSLKAIKTPGLPNSDSESKETLA